jgi:CRISPR-associated protein Cst2
MEIKGILVTLVAPFKDHIANGGEKLFGNASSIKIRPDGKVYVSGQMQRHVLFSAINRLNEVDPNKGVTFVSNGDGVTDKVESDLRADMGGFMITQRDGYSLRRTAPLSVTPAIAKDISSIGRDLLVRLKSDPHVDSKDQALATREYSQSDDMRMNFFLDVTGLSTSKNYNYEGGFNIGTTYYKHAVEQERKRRAELFLKATGLMNDYANQARNAVCGEPQQVLIVFDPVLSRKATRYFEVGDQERENILTELKDRGAKYFIGDDTTKESVSKAYKDALDYLAQNTLFTFEPDDNKVIAFEETYHVSDAVGNEAEVK